MIIKHADNLYVDVISEELQGIYREERRKNLITSISDLLETIMEKMNQKDKKLVFFIYGMHKKTKEYGCTKEILRNYVNENGIEEDFLEENCEESRLQEVLSTPTIPYPVNWIKETSNSTIRGCLLPGMILAAGITLPSVLWWMGIFHKPLSGELQMGKLIGAMAFFLVVTGYGLWKTLPLREKKKDVQYSKEEVEQKDVCLIPQTFAEMPIPIRKFPYKFAEKDVNTKLLQENGKILVVDEESKEGTFYNDKKLLPWQKISLKDGDLLRVAGKEYVVEITQSAYVM